MAIAKPTPTVVEVLRQQAGSSRRSQALDADLLRVLGAVDEADFDEVAAQVSGNPTLRDGLSGWLVSARSRGLLEQRATAGTRQRFAVTPLGRARLAAGG